MNEQSEQARDLVLIRQYMERSSRFISLSGFSGVSAGVCALIGCYLAIPFLKGEKNLFIDQDPTMTSTAFFYLNTWLFWIAIGTLVAAVASAFFFTFRKTTKQKIPIWGATSRRLFINLFIPLLVAGAFLLKMIHLQVFELIIPGCLLFYGLALFNASKYTLKEVRWLAISEILVGIVSLILLDYGIYFFAFGFGLLHIIYGSLMWWHYDRQITTEQQ